MMPSAWLARRLCRGFEPAAGADVEADATADHQPELRAPRRRRPLHPVNLQPELAARRSRIRPARPGSGTRLAQFSASLRVELPPRRRVRAKTFASRAASV